MNEPVQQMQSAVYYGMSVCSGLSCIPLWLAENKDAITAASALGGVFLSLVFGLIGLYMSRRK